MGAIVWTKSWSASDNGTVLGGADLQNIQNDITTVVNGGITNSNINASAAITESKIAFDTSAGHDHDGANSKEKTVSVWHGSFTRDTTLASGTQAITGVGFKPTMVVFFATDAATSEASWGVEGDASHGNAQWSLYRVASGSTYQAPGPAISDDEDGSNVYQGTISSWDSDGFTISWTKINSPTGTLLVGYVAFR